MRFTAAGNVCSFSAGRSHVADDALPLGDVMRAMSFIISGPSQRACVLFPRGAVRKL